MGRRSSLMEDIRLSDEWSSTWTRGALTAVDHRFASQACRDGSIPSECSRGPCGSWRRKATPRRVERGERAPGPRLHSEPDVRRTFEAKPSTTVERSQ
jgi:hypothetical protein